MGKQLLDEIVFTDYGQFDLAYSPEGGFDGDVDRFFDGQVNGLVGGADSNGIYVGLARRSGGSRVCIVVHDNAPSLGATWGDVVEVSTSVPPPGQVRWMSWGGESGGTFQVPAGDYRVRVSARGRDAGAANEFAEGVVDEYLIELWPAPLAADAVIRIDSQNAAYWHSEWGQRR